MSSLVDLVKSFNIAFNNEDYESCEKLAGPLKIELIKNNLLIPDFSKKDENYINDLNIAKRILELAALSSVFQLKVDSFKDYFSQIRVYYFCNISKLSESEDKDKIIGVYLLLLLSNGDTSGFHSELEFLSKHIDNLEDNELLSYPIKLEKWLMEGAYQKAWELLKSGSKVPEFDIFTESLVTAIREEIAHNTELAYDNLRLTFIKALLFLESEKAAEQFALNRDWKIVEGNVIFKKSDEQLEGDKDNMELEEEGKPTLISKTLNYAINLETIV